MRGTTRTVSDHIDLHDNEENCRYCRGMIRRYSCLLAVTVVGLVLRLISIDDWSLWGDEALTLLIVQWPLPTLFFAPADPTAGFYYAIHKVLLGPEVGVVAARSISVAAGTLLIPASFFLAKAARVPALLTATLIALSFPLIDYSQEARAYSLLILLTTQSVAFFLWWSRSDRLWHLAASLALAVLAFYTHFIAIFWVGPLALAALWTGKRRAVAPLLTVFILAMPEVSRLAQYHQPDFSWLLQASPKDAANTLARAVLPFRLAGSAALMIALVLGWRIWLHRTLLAKWATANWPAAVTLLIFFTIPLAIWLFGMILKPIFMPRTILIALPGILLALALLLSFEQRLIKIVAVGICAASLLVTGTMRPREDWRTMAARVGDDMVLMCQGWQGAAMRHALGPNSRVLLLDGDGLLLIEEKPWEVAYFNVLTTQGAMHRARERGQEVAKSQYPVWPIRTGSLGTMTGRPTTLGEAIQVCHANRADLAPRYQTD